MGYTGINLENVKNSNRSAILKLLNDQGAMSRKDIALELGLTPATVTLFCTELLAAGILLEKGEMIEAKRAGRKKVSIDINYRYKYVLTAGIEAAETCIAISDLKGRIVGMKKIKTETEMAPQLFLQMIADEGKLLMREYDIEKAALLGMGVSVPGPVKRAAGISLHAYRIWDEPVPVTEYLQQHLDLTVIIENNVKAFAEGELIYGTGKQWENLLFVKWGPGVGSAIIIDNKIYDSQNSKTAEIGHYIVEPGGSLCRCGRRGCLETHVATHMIAEQVRNACNAVTMPKLYEYVNGEIEAIQVKNMEEWIKIDDLPLQKLLGDIIERLARTVVNTITLLAPDQVIFYGYMFEMGDIQTRFLKCCKEYHSLYDETYILKSKLSDKIQYIGPLAVVVNELFFC